MAIRPEVSIVIPAYQAARHLRDTLACVTAQRMSELEIVVLDNNSTDETAEILKRTRDRRLRVERNSTTLPLADNWNAAVNYARGDLIKVLCADDLISADCIERQAATMHSNTGAALVACRVDMIDDAGHLVRRHRGLRGLTGERSSREVIRKVVRSGGNPIGPPAAVMFRRRDFDEVGGFDGDFTFPMELELWTRLLQSGSFVGDPATLASFRVSSTSITSELSIRTQMSEHRDFITRLAANPYWKLPRGDLAVASLTAPTMQARRTALQLRARRAASRH
ncbi:glycosyltransferase family 2 protein [Gordonia lacunae]|uniref:glycosyltransferase family 2 protein n=1 Tax=Gordonia TaxID=2053 RepID=UPI00200B9151|nr:glycosyltransferase [Gordonia terrae]UPW11973.1 glycosyltransferase [Gordonia terrae]